MRILILYRHFWPDSPPYASMLRTLGSHLAREGHEVTVWAEQPCYKPSDLQRRAPRREQLDGISVERMARLPGAARFGAIRLVDKLVFPLRILAKALRRQLRGERYDLVWTATIPPVAAGLVGRWTADLFGARFLYHCQDLYPEIAAHMGLWPRDGLVYRIAERIERKTRQRADLLVTLSNDMANTVREMAEPRRLAVINNFMLEDFSKGGADPSPAPSAETAPRNDGKVQIIFAGNLGQFQGLEAVVDAMRLIEHDRADLELVLMGEGKALPGLRLRAAGLTNVRFEPHRPFEDAQRLIAAADVGLVSLEPGIYRYAFPSKTLTYLGLGLPILAIVELESKLAESIRRDELGWVAPANNSSALGSLLSTLEIRDGDEPRRDSNKIRYQPASLGSWLQEIGSLV